jgi:hypothetical protein
MITCLSSTSISQLQHCLVMCVTGACCVDAGLHLMTIGEQDERWAPAAAAAAAAATAPITQVATAAPLKLQQLPGSLGCSHCGD